MEMAGLAGNDVHLIADEAYCPAGNHWPLANYPVLTAMLDPVYVEKHPFKNQAFGKFCILRWAILLEWMIQRGENRVFYADSDVLVCSDMDEVWKAAPPGEYSLSLCPMSDMVSPTGFHCISALRGFFQYLLRGYLEGSFLAWEEVLDMAVWIDFARTSSIPWWNSRQVINGGTIDHHMGHAADYKMVGGYKELRFVDGVPHAFHLPTREWVRLHTLHCWNDAEDHMENLVTLMKEKANTVWTIHEK